MPKKEVIQSVVTETISDAVVGNLDQKQAILESQLMDETEPVQPGLYNEAVAVSNAIQEAIQQQPEQKSINVSEDELLAESPSADSASVETLTAIGTEVVLADTEEPELMDSLVETAYEAEDQFVEAQNTAENAEIEESSLEDIIVPDFETSQDFIAYVESQEQVPDVVSLIETAPERPLAEVLAVIAVYFEHAPQEAGIELPPVLEKLQQLFKEDAAEVFARENPEMTPQLNALLVEVLETFGYSDSQDVLQAYIDDLGTKEALAILAYVSRLARGYDAQESSIFSTGITSQERLSSHIGKVLMQLVQPIKLERAV